MRITHGTMTEATMDRLRRRLEMFERAQGSVASGKAFSRPSEDVPAADRALRLRAELAAREQEVRNVDDGLSWVALADGRLGTATDVLQRARELALLGNNPSGQTERDALADEVAAIRDQLVGVANSRTRGRPLFAGYAGGDAVVGGPGAWGYGGDGGRVTRRVGEGEVVAVNVTADEIFGLSSGRDTFTILDDLEAALRAGDTTAISAAIGEVDTALDRVLDARATLGTAANRLESARIRLQEDLLTVRTQLSEVEDVDMAAAIAELQTQETAYQATLAALARSFQPSLAAFLG